MESLSYFIQVIGSDVIEVDDSDDDDFDDDDDTGSNAGDSGDEDFDLMVDELDFLYRKYILFSLKYFIYYTIW